MEWFLWGLLGFGPAAAIVIFGLRALRSGEGSKKKDLYDVSTVADWLFSASVLLAGAALERTGQVPLLSVALLCSLQLVTFSLLRCCLLTALLRREQSGPVRGRWILGSLAVSLFMAIGLSLYFLIGAWFDESRSFLSPTVNNYVYLSLIWLVAGNLAKRFSPPYGNWRRLAPCEFYSRILEIASKRNVKVSDVRILTGVSHIGALAYAGCGVGIGEEMLRKLTKAEVDAVVAHEVGHVADKKYWRFGTLGQYIGIILWICLMLLVERAISTLPVYLHFLQYVKWFLLFLVPPLIKRWYSRSAERNANKYLANLQDADSGITRYYKLSLLNQLPMRRPLWSRMISTHPDLQEAIKTIAERAGFSDDHLQSLWHRVEEEMENPSGQYYEPVYYDGAAPEVEKRPEHKWYRKVVITGAIMLGTAFLIAAVIVCSELPIQHATEYSLAIGFGGLLILVVTIILLYERLIEQPVRRRIATKLRRKYAGDADDTALLVDAVFYEDWDKQVWQGALLHIREGKLIVLGEARQTEIDLSGKITLSRRHYSEDTTHCPIFIWYRVDGVEQWIMIRNLRKPEKGLPRGLKQLERWLRQQLSAAGAELSVQKKLSRTEMYAQVGRGAAALLILAGVAALLEIAVRLSGFFRGENGRFFAYFVLLSSLGGGLWSWVRSAGQDDDGTTE